MKAQRSFFEQIGTSVSPGWSVRLAQDLQPGNFEIFTHSVRLYLIDTSSGWVGAGGLTEESFMLVHEQAQEMQRRRKPVASMAGQLLARLGASRPEAGAPELVEGLAMAALAMTLTTCFKKVRHVGCRGHWLYIGYRGHDASMVCRPVFLFAQDPLFMATDSLMQTVREVVRMDLENPFGSVSLELKRAGGSVLAEMFRC